MVFSGVVANAIGVVFGGVAGAFLGSKLPEKIGTALMKALALCVMFTGIGGITKNANILIAVISITIGTILGEVLDINSRIEKLGDMVQSKFSNTEHSIAEGFVNASLFTCMGAMAIVGAIESGMMGSPGTFYTKAIIDTVVVAVMATTMGIGCSLAGVSLFLYQGTITLLSGLLAHLLTAQTIEQMAYVGSILIFGIGFNMLEVVDIKVANLVFAPFIPIFLQRFF